MRRIAVTKTPLGQREGGGQPQQAAAAMRGRAMGDSAALRLRTRPDTEWCEVGLAASLLIGFRLSSSPATVVLLRAKTLKDC